MSTIKKHDHDLYPGENYAILTPAPEEDVFGFYGTVKRMVGEEMAIQLWDTASLVLSTWFREDDPAVVRNFLRSRYGRHLADEVANQSHPSNYENYAIMNQAVMDAVLVTDRKGRSFWTDWFFDIKATTENGEWSD